MFLSQENLYSIFYDLLPSLQVGTTLKVLPGLDHPVEVAEDFVSTVSLFSLSSDQYYFLHFLYALLLKTSPISLLHINLSHRITRSPYHKGVESGRVHK